MNAVPTIRCPNRCSRFLVWGLVLVFLQTGFAAEDRAHRFSPVQTIDAFQQAAAVIVSRQLTTNEQYCIGIPREGFRSNPAWSTRSEHQAGAALRKHLVDKFQFAEAKNTLPPHHSSSHHKWPLDLGANLGINPFCDVTGDPGRFWNWARVMAFARNPVGGGGYLAASRVGWTPHSDGFWFVTPDGLVSSYGNAGHFGSIAGRALSSSIVGMAVRPQRDGYWLVTAEGEVFPFGKAAHHGSSLGQRLNQPIVGICPAAAGDGYWLVARDGGVFSFDAPFRGALGATGVDNIVGMASTPQNGYWLLGSNGEVYPFDAPFKGSMSGEGYSDFVSITARSDGGGYWLLRENGAIHTFGIGSSDGFDPTLQLMTGLLRKSSLQSYSRAHEIPRYNSRVWQSDDGLGHNSVQAVAQSRDGYLWVGTSEGVSRFDGLLFTRLAGEENPEFNKGSVTAFAQGMDGSVWIGIENGGVSQWKDGRVMHFGQTNGLVSDRVRALCAASDGSIWIGTSDGLSRFQHGKFSTYTQTNGLSHNAIRALCEDREGQIWAGTGAGLNCISHGRITVIYRGGEALPSGAIRALYADDEGSLWIGSDGGLTRLREGKFNTYTRHDGLLENSVSAIFEDRKHNLWIGTLGGLNRMVGGRILAEAGDSGVFYDWIYSINEDLEGNVWVGSKNGLIRLSPKRFTTYTRQHGLSHNSIMSVCEDRSGALWIGTWGGGLAQLKDGKFTSVATQGCLRNNLVLAVHLARDGAVWAGLDFDGGLVRLKNGACTEYHAEQGLIDPAVAVIQEDRRGAIWLGTRTALVVLRDGNFTRYTTAEGLAGNNIKVILEDQHQGLWIGTTNGLSHFDGSKFISLSTREGLSNNRINALRQERDGTLWVGTAGGGLNRLSRNPAGARSRPVRVAGVDYHLSAYTTAEGLFNDVIYEIVEDRRGNFWLTTPKGVFRVRKRDFDDFDRGRIDRLTSVSFGKADGMVSIQCHGIAKPAGWLASDGRLWFPTATGLIAAEPYIKVNETPPPVLIEDVLADKRPVRRMKVDDADSLNDNPILSLVPPGRGELEFHYTALSFQWPEKNRFKYQLVGVDRDWVDAGVRRVAYYNNIPPGRYEFRVAGCNSDGIWNKAGATLAIVLLPQFWQTWWFKFAIVGMAGGLLVSLYQLRMAQLRKIEQLRVRIAADLHDEVGSSLWSISLLSGLLQKNEHLTAEDRNDASEINRIARQTANSVRDIVWFIKPEYDTMQDLVLRMRDVAGTLLTGIEFNFQNSQDDMSRRLPIDFRQNVFLMYKEILTNIARHSRATRVEIDVSEVNGAWQLRIHDNGVGFNTVAEFPGSGLKNLRRRAEKLKGSFEMTSQPGGGTTIAFSKSFR